MATDLSVFSQPRCFRRVTEPKHVLAKYNDVTCETLKHVLAKYNDVTCETLKHA